MSAEQDYFRIELGLDGGQIVQIEAVADQWDRLRAAIDARGSEWVAIQSIEEAEYLVLPERVSYARATSHAKRIGFGKD